MTEKTGPTIDRDAFRTLVQTYGASPGRWPEAVRSKAMAFAATEEGRSLALPSRRLDDALASVEIPMPSAALSCRILADGERWLSRRRRLHRWLLSAGLIGVGLAGGLTGAVVMMTVAPPPVLSINGTVTAFGELQYEGDIVLQEKP